MGCWVILIRCDPVPQLFVSRQQLIIGQISSWLQQRYSFRPLLSSLNFVPFTAPYGTSLAAWGGHMVRLSLPMGVIFLMSPIFYISVFSLLQKTHLGQQKYHENIYAFNIITHIITTLLEEQWESRHKLAITNWSNYWHLLYSRWASHVWPAGSLQRYIVVMSHPHSLLGDAPCRLCTSSAQ